MMSYNMSKNKNIISISSLYAVSLYMNDMLRCTTEIIKNVYFHKCCTKKVPNPNDDLKKMGNAFSDYNKGSLYRWERRK